MNPDNFFKELFDGNGDRVEAIRFQRQLAFEERVIKAAFRDCGIKITSWGRLVNSCKAITSQPKLNFIWFNSEYNFPLTLAGYRIPKLHELTPLDLFKQTEKNRLLRAIRSRLEKQEVDETRGFAFMFPIKTKLFCAHNINIHSGLREPAPGVRWTFAQEGDILLTVELASTLFQTIGPDWFEPEA